MTARILDGAAIAAAIREELKPRVAAFFEQAGRPPGLAIVLVGENPASEIYVRNKLRAASEVGLRADVERLPASASLSELLPVVERLNHSSAYDALLVQTPLPVEMGEWGGQTVFDAIDPDKDVDGFNPINVGRLVQNRAVLNPCTPAGVIELLERSDVAITGARAVVLGRSDTVGKPMALLLLHRHATVTICHSKTRDLAQVTRTADILIAAIGRAAFVTQDFVKPGATVIDVGINRVTDRTLVESWFARGTRQREAFDKRQAVVVGDVHPAVADVAGAISPVPGGVGPLTVAMLQKNTVIAAERRVAKADQG